MLLNNVLGLRGDWSPPEGISEDNKSKQHLPKSPHNRQILIQYIKWIICPIIIYNLPHSRYPPNAHSSADNRAGLYALPLMLNGFYFWQAQL